MKVHRAAVLALSTALACSAALADDEDAPLAMQAADIHSILASSCSPDNWPAECTILTTLDQAARSLLDRVRAGTLSEVEAKRRLTDARMVAKQAAREEAERQERQRVADEQNRLAEAADKQKAEHQRKVQACKDYMWGASALNEAFARMRLCDIDPEAPFKLPPPASSVSQPVVVVGHE